MNPICECGYKFTVDDVGVYDGGPDNRTMFFCPDCHCIMEMNSDEVDL